MLRKITEPYGLLTPKHTLSNSTRHTVTPGSVTAYKSSALSPSEAVWSPVRLYLSCPSQPPQLLSSITVEHPPTHTSAALPPDPRSPTPGALILSKTHWVNLSFFSTFNFCFTGCNPQIYVINETNRTWRI